MADEDISRQPSPSFRTETQQLATAATEELPKTIASVEMESAPPAQRVEPAVVYEQVGVASWYGDRHQGRPTASGEPFDQHKLTAAHRSLPLATKARITNLANGRSVEVTVNDRGPYIRGRVIDLSKRAAQELGMAKKGLARVRIEVWADETDGSTAN